MNKFITVLFLLTISILIASSQSVAGELVIKGSTTVLPIAQKAAEAYMAENPDVKISLSGGGSGNGIKAIIDGTADIGNASRFIKQKEVDLAGTKHVYPVPFRVALTAPSNGGIVQAVAITPGAIGYVGLGYLNREIKAVSVEGVPGTEENTLNGSFPISRGLLMFTKGWPEGDTMGFISFILSKNGQKLVKEAGSIPLF